jgi:hypothetical protein
MSSVGELGVTIKAVNEATSEFEAVAADAASMSSAVSASPLVLKLENLASPEIDRVAEDAARVKAGVEGSPVTISFAPVEVPSIPAIEVPPIETSFAPIEPPIIPPIEAPTIMIDVAPIEVPPLPPVDTAPIQESLSQVGVAAANVSGDIAEASISSANSLGQVGARAVEMGSEISDASSVAADSFAGVGASVVEMGAQVEAASSSFTDMQTHVETCEVSLRSISSGIRSFGMMGTEVTMLASNFGLVDKQTAQWMRTIAVMITLVATAARMYSFLSMMTTGQTAAVAIEGTTETATTGAISLSAVAHNIYAAACQVATAAENALNISHATFLALTGVGIGVIIAAAAAISVFASQMNSATASVNNYNAAASKVPTVTKGIQRAQEQNMLRRGVE